MVLFPLQVKEYKQDTIDLSFVPSPIALKYYMS